MPTCVVKGVFGGRNVTFNTETEGATIYYAKGTSNLTTGDLSAKNGETVSFDQFYGTIYFRAYKDGAWSEANKIVLKIPTINKPNVTQSGNQVTIQTTTPKCHIWYTTDGSDPVVDASGKSTNATRLTMNSKGTFALTKSATVKAIAVRGTFTNSDVVTEAVKVVKPNAPNFVVKGVIGGRNVTFNAGDLKDGYIYYSTKTSNITTSDKRVKIVETVLFENYYGSLYAKVYVNGQWSNPSRLILRIPTVSTPVITAEGNGYVRIKTGTPSCAVYYTTDGSTPSLTNGKRINSSSTRVYVGKGKTVKAIAVRSCFTNSDVATKNS